jgi:hypothetical protein
VHSFRARSRTSLGRRLTWNEPPGRIATREMADPEVNPSPGRVTGVSGMIVASVGLVVLLGIVAIAILSLPDGDQKAQNVVAIATSGFGVIGAVVGAYFGVRAAGKAVDQVAHMQERTEARRARTSPPAGT